MKVKFRENVYTPIPTERSTCVDCVFLSANKGMCKAPDSIYIYLVSRSINYFIILKNFLKYLNYENRI